MAKPLLIILRISDSNHPHIDKLRFMVLIVDYHIRMYMSELNYEDYFPLITELEYDENEEVPGKYVPPEYLSYDEDMSNTEDVIPSQDKNQLGGKILALWERYKPILEHDYSRPKHMPPNQLKVT